MRQIINLNGPAWQVGSVPQKPFGDVNDLRQVQEWLPAQVPGDVRLDLLRADRISNPFYGTNNEESQWVDGRDWWYVRELEKELEPKLEEGAGGRAFLVFEGIDYQSAVFVNGKQVGRHVGMFSPQVYEINRERRQRGEQQTSAPRFGGNETRDGEQSVKIGVRVWGADALPKMHLTPAQRIWSFLVAPLLPPPNKPFPDRYATLKCQMQFGWDFAPRLRTCGIWDDAYVVFCRSVFVENIWVKAQPAGLSSGRNGGSRKKSPLAEVQTVLTLDSDRPQHVRVRLIVRGKNIEVDPQTFAFDLHLGAGRQTHILAFQLRDPQLWNPWDRGEPNLYELDLQIISPNIPGFLDTLTTTFGIRTFALALPAGAGRDAEPWVFVINGEHEFIRGANWVPLDAIPGRLGREDYRARLEQVRRANINFLRVWGGGLREKRAFYELCDEMGILVWQEFPFAGAILDRFPTHPAFLDLVQDEARAVVQFLRQHPSLVIWCGGNEFNTRGNHEIVKTLLEVVVQEDGTRPFKPASPYRDESHNWRVWHRMANLSDYKKDLTPFLSEFGLQSAPDVESLKKFLPEDRLFPPNETWTYHHAELEKLERYARSANPEAKSLQAFVAATQDAQAHGLQVAIEHVRRRKGATAGVAIWQFNDAWPAITWGVVDYYGKPKRAYEELARLYSPVLASFEYTFASGRKRRSAEECVRGKLWLINDSLSAFETLDLHVLLNGSEIDARRASLVPGSAECIGALDVQLSKGDNILRLVLQDSGRVLSDHEYDLNFRDRGNINPLVALLYPIYMKFVR